MMGKLPVVLRNVCLSLFGQMCLQISDWKWHMPSSRKEMYTVAGYYGSSQLLLCLG